MTTIEVKREYSNEIAGKNLTDKWVVVPRTQFVEARATGGFGCNPNTHGSAVFVEDEDGNKWRAERHDVQGIEKEQEDA